MWEVSFLWSLSFGGVTPRSATSLEVAVEYSFPLPHSGGILCQTDSWVEASGLEVTAVQRWWSNWELSNCKATRHLILVINSPPSPNTWPCPLTSLEALEHKRRKAERAFSSDLQQHWLTQMINLLWALTCPLWLWIWKQEGRKQCTRFHLKLKFLWIPELKSVKQSEQLSYSSTLHWTYTTRSHHMVIRNGSFRFLAMQEKVKAFRNRWARTVLAG